MLMVCFINGVWLIFISIANRHQTSVAAGKDKLGDAFQAFKRKELQMSRVKNYDLTYGLFAKAPSWPTWEQSAASSGHLILNLAFFVSLYACRIFKCSKYLLVEGITW